MNFQIAQDEMYPIRGAAFTGGCQENHHQFEKCHITERFHGVIDYLMPKDKLEGRDVAIFADRKRKLAKARERRARRHRQAEPKATSPYHHYASLDIGAAYAGLHLLRMGQIPVSR